MYHCGVDVVFNMQDDCYDGPTRELGSKVAESRLVGDT